MVAGDRAGNGSWRKACCAGGYLGETLVVGDTHGSRDTPKGTAAHGGSRLEHQKSQKEGPGEEKSKKPGAAARNHRVPSQFLALPVVSSKGLAGTEHNVVKTGREGTRGRERCWSEAEPGEAVGKGFHLVVSLFLVLVSQ